MKQLQEEQAELTTGEIIARSGLPFWKVAYVIRTRAIKPSRRLGRVLLYPASVVNQVIAESAAIDSRKRVPVASVA